ncbi:MAG TPA: 4Fe-4S dicluster domain-containing protein [Desulfatirhabdiaceae bacterium]|nr:4Fe-4S dicluster domain-containing protein [Desulfatirhabdiaceae bacterium]
MSYLQVNHRCNGCLACLENCPANAIDVRDSDGTRTILHNMARCARCGNCWRICPQQAIDFQHMLVNQWDEVVSLALIHCQVCGEPLYTSAYYETLAEKPGVSPAPLCSLHKEALALKVNTHFAGRMKAEG